jgi:Domain of unknown function (DUF4337)
METNELAEFTEKAHASGERHIGVTMAVIAALLAVATLMGHRIHTEELVLQTKSTDSWAFFQAKDGRYHMYTADAKLAELQGAAGQAVAAEWKKKAEQERAESDEIRKESERMERETERAANRSNYFDGAEICLEVAIVLCSITLLTGTRLFWKLSLVGAVIGVALMVGGLF